MSVLKYVLVLLMSLLFLSSTHGYTLNYMDNGSVVRWHSSRAVLDINLSSHSTPFSNAELRQIMEHSVSQWNRSQKRFKIIDNYVSRAPTSITNDLYFSSNTLYFGPNVAGVTITSTDQESGELLNSDIIINNSLQLSLDKGDQFYIGDIVTHEIGHFLGLAHSEVPRSSMLYRLTRGQHQTGEDDLAGVRALYSQWDYSTLVGRVEGGDGVGVFGAHVQAISLISGKIQASAISQENGDFRIDGLDGDDRYVIYIDRIKGKETLPKRFAEVKSDFCYSGLGYRGSFYQSCYSRDEGYPQVIELKRGQLRDIGVLTIRCGLDVPVEYMQKKPSEPWDIDIVKKFNNQVFIEETLTGFFTQNEVNQSLSDEFRIEIESDDIPADSSDNVYLEIKTLSQVFNSPLRLSLRVEDQGAIILESQVTDDLVLFDDGTPSLDNSIRFPLDLSASTLNQLTITVTPEDINDYRFRIGSSLDNLIPAHGIFMDPLHFYLLTMRVVVEKQDQFKPLSFEQSSRISSNKSCLDAPETYSVDSTDAFASSLVNSRRNSRDSSQLNALGCGMILMNNDKGPPGGSGTAVVAGFLFVLILSAFTKTKSIRNYAPAK